ARDTEEHGPSRRRDPRRRRPANLAGHQVPDDVLLVAQRAVHRRRAPAPGPGDARRNAPPVRPRGEAPDRRGARRQGRRRLAAGQVHGPEPADLPARRAEAGGPGGGARLRRRPDRPEVRPPELLGPDPLPPAVSPDPVEPPRGRAPLRERPRDGDDLPDAARRGVRAGRLPDPPGPLAPQAAHHRRAPAPAGPRPPDAPRLQRAPPRAPPDPLRPARLRP